MVSSNVIVSTITSPNSGGAGAALKLDETICTEEGEGPGLLAPGDGAGLLTPGEVAGLDGAVRLLGVKLEGPGLLAPGLLTGPTLEGNALDGTDRRDGLAPTLGRPDGPAEDRDDSKDAKLLNTLTPGDDSPGDDAPGDEGMPLGEDRMPLEGDETAEGEESPAEGLGEAPALAEGLGEGAELLAPDDGPAEEMPFAEDRMLPEGDETPEEGDGPAEGLGEAPGLAWTLPEGTPDETALLDDTLTELPGELLDRALGDAAALDGAALATETDETVLGPAWPPH